MTPLTWEEQCGYREAVSLLHTNEESSSSFSDQQLVDINVAMSSLGLRRVSHDEVDNWLSELWQEEEKGSEQKHEPSTSGGGSTNMHIMPPSLLSCKIFLRIVQKRKQSDVIITRAEVRTLLTNLGEKYMPEEIDCMVEESDPDDTGRIQYEDLIKIVMQ